MLAQFPAVIAPENDDGVVLEVEFLELFQQSSHLRVDEADRCVIAMFEATLLRLGQRAIARIVCSGEIEVIAQLVHRVHGQGGRVAGQEWV
jgi:hypothetical protein